MNERKGADEGRRETAPPKYVADALKESGRGARQFRSRQCRPLASAETNMVKRSVLSRGGRRQLSVVLTDAPLKQLVDERRADERDGRRGKLAA